MSAVIKVENLSKQYRLGDVGTGTLRDDFKRWTHRIMGKEDPFLKIGEENDRSKKGESDYVWALKDINFEVEQGDVVGIIGRNGAGKSTLLKILSRTTAPTTGSVRVKGRIASLLEVGTGFHGELSGRENIYLNGAIMGLRKWEIDKKLDEIIDFAGVDKYLDTPVKRYSSGMYVRLAFAVAAHLEPDILIVDEVLAVGDAEFQKKCLGKMKDVSQGQGRTVLFVSHNMQTVQKICRSALLMNNGTIQKAGDIKKIVNHYLNNSSKNKLFKIFDQSTYSELQLLNGYVESVKFENLDGNEIDLVQVGQYWQLRVKFKLIKPQNHFIIGIGISTSTEIPVYTAWSKPSQMNSGSYEAVFKNDKLLFASGSYELTLGLSEYERSFHFVERAINLDIIEIKDESIISEEKIIRTSGTGMIINTMNITITDKN